MKQPKTESSSIGDLFALSSSKQHEYSNSKINWKQVGIQLGGTALLLWILYWGITKAFERHTNTIMPAPVQPMSVKPNPTEPTSQSEIADVTPAIAQIVSAPEKKSSQLL